MKLCQKRKLILGVSMLVFIGGASFYSIGLVGSGRLDQKDMSCYKELVCDGERIFSKEHVNKLEEYHKALLKYYDIDLRVLTGVASSEQSVAIFKAAKIGENSKTRKGMLLLIDSKSDMVRLEISAGLDAVYTDGFVAYIQQRQMVPFFQANQVANGILASTEMFITRAQEAIAGKAFISPEQLPKNLAIGAGAQTKASIGAGYKVTQAINAVSKDLKGASPKEIVVLYHKALWEGNKAYNLPIYSVATQRLKKSWVVTAAQMKNELKAYRKCTVDKIVIMKERNLAVVRYKVDDRKCAPYFLVMEDGAWRLDFKTMMQNIRFGRSNSWHFDMKKPIPYADAFSDWRLNYNGYPFKVRWGVTVSTIHSKGHSQCKVFVKKIAVGTPAASMALQEKDIILNWNGIENPHHRQVLKDMGSVEAGAVVKVQILRNGQEMTLKLKAPPKV